MARPEKYEDVRESERKYPLIAEISTDEVGSGKMMVIVGKFIAECEDAGLQLKHQYSKMQIVRDANEVEKAQVVKMEQELFDRGREKYDTVMATGSKVPDNEWQVRQEIRAYCDYDDMPLPW